MKQYKKSGKVKQTFRIPVPKPTKWHSQRKRPDVDFCELCIDKNSVECDECEFGI